MKDKKTGKQTVRLDIFHQDELSALKIAIDSEYYRVLEDGKLKNLSISLHTLIDRIEQMERDGKFDDLFTKDEYYKMKVFGKTDIELPLGQRLALEQKSE